MPAFNRKTFSLAQRARAAALRIAAGVGLSALALSATPARAQAPVSVDGAPIDTRIFNEQFALLRGRLKGDLAEPARLKLAARAARVLVQRLLVQAELGRQKLAVREEDVDKRVAQMVATFPSKERYLDYLSRLGFTEEGFRHSMWVKEGAFVLLKASGALKPTREQLQARYNALRSQFEQPERYHARQVLLPIGADAPADKVQEVFGEIQKVHAVYLEGKIGFEELVARYSLGPMRHRKGDIGYFAKGELVEVIEQAVLALKEGDVSPPVRSAFGWHILQRLDTSPARAITLDQAAPGLTPEVEQLNLHNQLLPYLRALLAKAKVVTDLPIRF